MAIISRFRTKPHGGFYSRDSTIMYCTQFHYQHLLVFNTKHSKRLGHLSNSITSTALKKSNIIISPDVAPLLCRACSEGKFSKLTFAVSVSKYIIHFEVVHSDVWGLLLVNL